MTLYEERKNFLEIKKKPLNPVNMNFPEEIQAYRVNGFMSAAPETGRDAQPQTKNCKVLGVRHATMIIANTIH
ncbi:MAG: hypothetical protein IK105_01530 [Thermoguttaceae bacterium]|nr:hypothetical protein [Thermoguttaceae bacterium]